jgi:Protein of unknown function (DUF3703)
VPFRAKIRPYIDAELTEAARQRTLGNVTAEFHRLERAHILGQPSTTEHVRIHGRMLVWAVRNGDSREFIGQVIRIAGAATKTIFGLVPTGNTGGANVSPVKPMPVPPDLEAILTAANLGDA